MTDVEKYQAGELDLQRWAEDASRVHGVAKALADTGMVPRALQGRPDDITAVILAGREMGLPPMTALRSIEMIEGKPGVSANAQRGIAMAAGVVFELRESTDTRVVMRARAPGAEQWTEVVWDTDRARKMELATKSNWRKMPRSMLIARATSELCRLVAANLLLGLPYSTEELHDIEPAVGGTDEPARPAIVTPAPVKRTARRAPRPTYDEVPTPEIDPPRVPVPEIEAAPEVVDEPEPEPAVSWEEESVAIAAVPEPAAIAPRAEHSPAISPGTRAVLMATLRGAGHKGQDERLRVIQEFVGRRVEVINQITEAEGWALIVHTDPEQAKS